MDQNHNDLTFSQWEWPPDRLSPSHCGTLDVGPECKVLSFQRTPPPGSFLSLSLLPGFGPIHLTSIFHQDSGFGRSCVSEPQINSIEDDEELSPLDCRSLLASPFSDDSDSDDGLAPSPFSSPESGTERESDDENFSPPSTPERGHGYPLGDYPNLELYRDRPDDDTSLSYSLSFSAPTSIPDGRIPLSTTPSSSSHEIEEGLQSPSPLLPTPLPFYYFDHPPSAVPDSPRYRAVDLPAFEDEIDSKGCRFGLGLHSTGSSHPFDDFHFGDEVPPPPGFLQRTTWLSLPGAETDDDLIPAELGSKTYIPDPSITIPTTPPSRSLLIWDPTTRSGLPAGLPSFDGTGRTTHRFDADALPIRRPHSPEEDFDVDPALLAKLVENDAEKGVEVRKLCELKQRTTIAACKGREGTQVDERVREKWREVTALLRLKLASDKEVATTIGVINDERGLAASGGAEDDGSLPISAPLLGAPTLSSLITRSESSPSVPTDSSSTPSTLDCQFATPSTSPQIRRRTPKPKITSMAQLVANMVFHRQQDALRRSPIRSRTWSPVSSMTNNSALGKTRSWSQTSPTSPLRQMILPEDIDTNSDSGNFETGNCDSPLQLSPLCLSLCKSPESFYAQLDATTSVPLSTS